jgi:hypothetical protein
MPIMLFLAYCVKLAGNAISPGCYLFAIKRLSLVKDNRQDSSRNREVFDFELLVAILTGKVL